MRKILLTTFVLTAACGAATNGADSGVDAGPCSPSLQSGCGSGEKCSVRPDTGQPLCLAAGALTAFTTCAADTDCVSGTICLNTPAMNGFEGGQTCHPFCNPSSQAHLACSQGGSCELVDTHDSSIGFCVRPAASDGGP
ncbi:MAG: hypothetical protein QM723_01955 [Myxococcaceae bacterium]